MKKAAYETEENPPPKLMDLTPFSPICSPVGDVSVICHLHLAKGELRNQAS